ncbi:MAG: sigma-54-dependent Fis family transcriptional regulator [Armatimonadetes bacterium]|nr:sigma-54-dependent Fis family transcriptional regulator [Armatimonadota bacterium]
MPRVLLIEDDEALRHVFGQFPKRSAYDVVSAKSAQQGLEVLEGGEFDIVLTDLTLENRNSGLEVLARAKNIDPRLEVIIFTAFGSVSTAVEAMKAGAYDYLTKPVSLEVLRLTVERAVERRRLIVENSYLRRTLGEKPGFANLESHSALMKNVLSVAARVAEADVTVLISGESGTGKEVLARAIHQASARRNAQFLAVNCAALPEALLESELFGHVKGAFTGAVSNRRGLFEEANGGTFLLDEIGEASPGIQVKMLRVLEEREIRRVGDNKYISVDVRLIAATNRDLAREVREGRFREDLLYRINVIPLEIPPLRKRREDIPLLVNHFLKRMSLKLKKSIEGVCPNAMALLKGYSFPGNVRELENMLERASILCKGNLLEQTDIALAMPSVEGVEEASILPRSLEEIERNAIQESLERCAGNVARAARELKIGRATMWRKMQRYDLEAEKW